MNFLFSNSKNEGARYLFCETEDYLNRLNSTRIIFYLYWSLCLRKFRDISKLHSKLTHTKLPLSNQHLFDRLLFFEVKRLDIKTSANNWNFHFFFFFQSSTEIRVYFFLSILTRIKNARPNRYGDLCRPLSKH